MNEPPSEVVGVDTRYWGEQGGRYSADRRYRWSYAKTIGDGPTICWIGLNPGTGDTEGRYRPTLQRMVDRSVAEGMGQFVLVNLFAWRATKPADLRAAARAGEDVVGAGCDAAVLDAVAHAAVVVAAWGGGGTLLGRDRSVIAMLGDAQCLGLTAKGSPRHPLFVPASQPLVRLHDGRAASRGRHGNDRPGAAAVDVLPDASEATGNPIRGHTKSGVPITDELIERLVDEAERGYGVDEIIARRVKGERPRPVGEPSTSA